MMQLIRDKAHGLLAWVVVVLISVPFALWGIQQYFGTNPNLAVASVNGSEIPLREFQEALQRQRASLQSLLGAGQNIDALDESRLKKETLDRLVEEEVVVQSGTGDGLRISDEQLARAIRQQSAFQDSGAFSQDRYDRWLSQQGLSQGRFEYLLRRSMLSGQLREGISGSAIATSYDTDHLAELLRQQRRFTELVVPVSRFEEVDIADEAIDDYYTKNKSRFVSPEQMRVAYVVLSRAAVENTIDATEEELRSLYEERKASYGVPEQRRASHILIRVGKDQTEDVARTKIEELRRRLSAGASFEELAQANSDDPGSASRGGDLGYFGKGVMDPAFEKAVFALSENETSEPVRSQFGYHLIRVTGIRPANVKSFESVRADLLADFRGQAAESLYLDEAERLASLTFEQPDTLEAAAESLDLTIRESDFFSRDGIPGDDIFGDGAVTSAAFEDDVLREGNNSSPIELGGERVVVLRALDHRESSQRPLAEVREEIRGILRQRLARQRARTLGEELLRRLQAGEDPGALATENGLTWTEEKSATRTSDSMGPDALRALFRMQRPQGEPVYDAVIAANGDFTLLGLRSVESGGADENGDENERKVTRLRLAQEFGRAQFETFLESLRASADVELHQDRL